MTTLAISSKLLLPKHLSRRVGRRVWSFVATEKTYFSFLWAGDRQQHFERYLQFAVIHIVEEGLSLQTFFEGKRKRDFRNFSVTSMGSPGEQGHLHVIDSEPSKDLGKRDSGKSAGAFWRRKAHPNNANKLSSSIFVDPPFLRFLVGKGGTTREKIENDTGVTLLIPLSKEAEAGKHVELLGESEEALEEATQQLREVIDQAIRSPLPYSHFVSIPLALHSNLLESVIDFQKSVLKSDDSSSDGPGLKGKGIDKSIFIKPATFHLTLLMLKLWNNDRVQAAADCLQRVMPRVHEALEGSPLTIKLTGVDCMNGNPAKAHVLYADVEPDDRAKRLVQASQVITEAFTEAGLVLDKDQTQTLKLHATLMNSSQRSRGGKSFFKRIPFDATDVMTEFEQYEWGEYHVSEAHLSQRFLYDENGYYHCCSSIPFPQISTHVPTRE